MEQLEHHEYANLFPMMQGAELEALAASIRSGYDETMPIVLFEGMILDGRNRYRAAQMAGVAPVFTAFQGGDPLEFVIRHNLMRRHLNESQRGVIAGKLANMKNHAGVSANLHSLISQENAADMMNVSRRTVATIKAVERAAPELIEKIENGQMTANEASKKVGEMRRFEQRTEMAKLGESVKPSDKWHVYHGDITNWKAPRQYDFIITDPPYPREYIPLYEVLARRSVEWLKPGGLLFAMCGQSYLNQIYEIMSNHIEYYWTGCYLMPGQITSLKNKNVNTNWKPILIFQNGKYTGKIFNDTFISEASDKSFHEWGQSVSGMNSIISKVCSPGQYILDPFCGAGTTGVAALQNVCLFDGLDKEIKSVEISKARLHDTTKTR
jgi:16S rRNA G966 N2-methylase RsmD